MAYCLSEPTADDLSTSILLRIKDVVEQDRLSDAQMVEVLDCLELVKHMDSLNEIEKDRVYELCRMLDGVV